MHASAFLFVEEPGADPERLDLLASLLRAELSDGTDVEVARLRVDEVPQGARAVDAAAAGALVVALGQSGALGLVVDLVRKWLRRSPAAGRSVRLQIGSDTLEVSDASSEVQEQLVGAFLARYAATAATTPTAAAATTATVTPD